MGTCFLNYNFCHRQIAKAEQSFAKEGVRKLTRSESRVSFLLKYFRGPNLNKRVFYLKFFVQTIVECKVFKRNNTFHLLFFKSRRRLFIKSNARVEGGDKCHFLIAPQFASNKNQNCAELKELTFKNWSFKV